MSGVIDSFGDPDRSRPSRLFTRTAHLLPPVVAATAAAMLIDDVGGGVLPDWLSWTVTAGYVAVYIAASAHRSFARICIQCMQEVPANAGEQADRRRWLLWIEHHPGKVVLLWLGLFGASLAARALLGIPKGPSLLNLPFEAVLLGSVMATWTHHRLRPWCRYCRRWDDGSGPHERVPNPDPAGVKSS